MKFFNRYLKPDLAGIDFSEAPSLTEQHHLPSLDINNIVDRAISTGVFGDPHQHYTFGNYADVSDVDTFLEMQIHTAEAKEAFLKLPSEIRFRFMNDPHRLLEFLDNPSNRSEAEKLGLIKKVPVSPEVGTGNPLDITVPTDSNASGGAAPLANGDSQVK